jgi:N-acetylmuramoyl-L-alanine amidase
MEVAMHFVSLKRNGMVISLVVFASALVGCTEPGSNMPITIGGVSGPKMELVGVDRLSADLNLRVADRSASHATLRNESNIVMIYPDPHGQAFVNGRPVGNAGGIIREQGEILISLALEKQIQQAMNRPSVVSNKVAVSPRPNAGLANEPARRTAAGGLAGGRVMVDPGHGGDQPGAISVLGTYEKVITLDVGTKVANNLETSGVQVAMTHKSDRRVELEDRAAKANHMGADLFVSIHADSAPRASAHGFTVYISPNAGGRTMSAAEAIERSMKAAGYHSLGIRRAGYRVLVKSEVPAVLVELGYLTNATEAGILANAAQRSVYAQAISEGICDFLREQTPSGAVAKRRSAR